MRKLPIFIIVIMAVMCGCNQKKVATTPVESETMDSDTVICQHIKAYLLRNDTAVILSDSAKEDLFESSWPEVFCSVDKTLDAPWKELTVRKVADGKYKYECICPIHGDKFVDNWTISAHIEHGAVVIKHITMDEVKE